MMKKSWWKEGVIYQIYPRSFKDTNGDGIGDLPGIIEKMDYLAELGITILWLSPVYASPNADNGYDISDYYQIHPDFGTMADFERLLAAAHKRGIRLVMDLVVNHTSDEHPWFAAARKSKDNPYRDYYIWRSGKHGAPPNNWPSFFGGDAWTRDPVTGEYYLHLFTPKQPDLNWENPRVRQEVYRLMRFWLDKGVDGFRMDVIPLISKRTDFEDTQLADFRDIIEKVYANGPRVHEFLQEMHREVMAHYDMTTIAEGVGIPPEQALDYVGAARQEIDMLFHFGHMFIDHGPAGRMDPRPWDKSTLFNIFLTWDRAVGASGWTCLYLGNHDFPRQVSRFGNDGPYREAAAKCLATLLMTLRGTPSVYQGDEIGMPNTPFSHVEEYRDIELLNFYREAQAAGKDLKAFLEAAQTQARDHARTPFLWEDAPQGGFTAGTPWIKVHPDYPRINAASQMSDPGSIWHFYRRVIQLRRQTPALIYGALVPLWVSEEGGYVYERHLEDEKFRIYLNMGDNPWKAAGAELPPHNACVLTNGGDPASLIMQPWEARVYTLK